MCIKDIFYKRQFFRKITKNTSVSPYNYVFYVFYETETFIIHFFYTLERELVYFIHMAVTQKKYVGDLGEDIACRFLVKHGFIIKDRNYLKKYGEIDIIAEKDKQLHFVEVKSVSRRSEGIQNGRSEHSPEENVHPWKLKRLARTIESYLSDKKVDVKGGLDSDWQFDVVVVFLYTDKKLAEVKFLQNIMLA